jgi:hypothetical protein
MRQEFWVLLMGADMEAISGGVFLVHELSPVRMPMKRWPLWTLAFVTFGATSTCFGAQSYRWQEEVLLHDGRVIVIDRSVRTGEVPVEIGQSPGESDYTLMFTANDNQRVTWEGGRDRFKPMILEFADGVPYVVARGSTGLVYPREGCPKPPYFFFRWGGDRWESVPYPQLPGVVRSRNLSADPTYSEPMRRAVSRGLATQDDVRASHRGLNPEDKAVREDAPTPMDCVRR